MEKTVVAVFDKRTEAEAALADLTREGSFSSPARISSADESAADDTGLAGEGDDLERSERRQSSEGGIGEAIARFFGMGDDGDTYHEAVKRGGYVVTLDVRDDAEADRAEAILYRHNPIDIDERTEQWRQEGWEKPIRAEPEDRFVAPLPENDMALTGGAGIADEPDGQRSSDFSRRAEPTTADARVIPVVEEQLNVGKREVQRGGVRIVTRTIEKPVEAGVSLQEEHATVTRRPVDRPVTDADSVFKEQTIEVRETVEEAVVSKTARVVEEVEISKESLQREQVVRDMVRRTDVDVEQIGSGDITRGGSTASQRLYAGPERRTSSSGTYGGVERRMQNG